MFFNLVWLCIVEVSSLADISFSDCWNYGYFLVL